MKVQPPPDPPSPSPRLRAASVRLAGAPLVVGGKDPAGHRIAVEPILEGDRIARLEIRCGCGQELTVLCLYGEEGGEGDTARIEEV